MKRALIVITLMTAFAFSMSAQDYAMAAKEYCDCFQKATDTMDTEFRQLIIRVAKQSDIRTAFSSEMTALDAEKQRRLGQQLEMLGTVMQSEKTESGRCGITVDKKYEKYNDNVGTMGTYNGFAFNRLSVDMGCGTITIPSLRFPMPV